MRSAARNPGQARMDLVARARQLAAKILEPGNDDAERRPQFVGDQGKKYRLLLTQFLLLLGQLLGVTRSILGHMPSTP